MSRDWVGTVLAKRVENMYGLTKRCMNDDKLATSSAKLAEKVVPGAAPTHFCYLALPRRMSYR